MRKKVLFEMYRYGSITARKKAVLAVMFIHFHYTEWCMKKEPSLSVNVNKSRDGRVSWFLCTAHRTGRMPLFQHLLNCVFCQLPVRLL
jgi:hypothetical protein